MKMLLNFGILLLICAKEGFFAPVIVKREMNRGQMVSDLNAARKQLANAFQVPNMQELKWNSELEKKAEKMTCETLVPGPNYITVASPSDAAMNSVQSMTAEMKTKFAETVGEEVGKLFDPEQSGIGCAETRLEGGCNVEGVCLMGPKGSYTKNNFKEGEPGSQCPNGKASSGLCNASSSIFSSAFILIFIVSLNFI